MIRNNSFIKRKIATQYVIVAVGEATRRFNGMISINSTGSYIWDLLEKEMSMDELLTAFLAYYDVDKETATRDVTAFVSKLKEVGAIAE